MISNILLFAFAMFIAQPTDETPKREMPQVVMRVEYAEKPKELEFNEFVGFYYEE